MASSPDSSADSAPPRPKFSFRDVLRLHPLAEYLKPYRRAIAGALIAIIVSASTTLALGQGLRAVIDKGFATGSQDLLDEALIFMLAVVIIMSVASFSRYYLISWIGERVVADLRQAVYAHLLTLSLSFYEREKVGSLLSRLTTDTSLVQTVVGSAVPIALRNLIIMIGGTTLLVYTSPKLTGVVAAFVPIILIQVFVLARRVRKLSRQSQDRVADVGAYTDESLHAISTVYAFNHEEADKTAFHQVTEGAFSTAISRIRVRAFLSSSVIFMVFLGITIMLWIGANDVFEGTLSGGELASFVFYALITAGAVAALSDVMGDINRATGSVDRIFELLEEVPEINPPVKPQKFPAKIKGAIEFEDLTFAYPSRPKEKILDNFSLQIKPGEKIAFVGHSGAGKTTIFNLLLRFYDPQYGDIQIDKTSILKTRPRDTRALIGIVPQDPVIFSGNAYDNISYGHPSATHQEIEKAAKAAAADEFIQNLPEGYNTFLGQKGVRLSGGQKQRLAIARAILMDPCILLLDEATSALDATNEALVQKGLENLMKNRTTLIISHRMSTIQQADKIVVLNQGKIEAVGPHGQLIKSSKSYQAFIKQQATKKN